MNEQNTPPEPSSPAFPHDTETSQSGKQPKLESLDGILEDWENEADRQGQEEAPDSSQARERSDRLLHEIKQLQIDLAEAQLQTQFFFLELNKLLTQERDGSDQESPDSLPQDSSALVRLGKAFLLTPLLFWSAWTVSQWLQRLIGPWRWPGSMVLTGGICLILGGFLVLAGRSLACVSHTLLEALMDEGCDEDEGMDCCNIFGEPRRAQPYEKGEHHHE